MHVYTRQNFAEDGVIGAEEFRYDCVSRIAVDNVDVLDKAYQSLLNVSEMIDRSYSSLKLDLIRFARNREQVNGNK